MVLQVCYPSPSDSVYSQNTLKHNDFIRTVNRILSQYNCMEISKRMVWNGMLRASFEIFMSKELINDHFIIYGVKIIGPLAFTYTVFYTLAFLIHRRVIAESRK
jgi:hypothetical protein